jgi:hypothetical protein
MIGSVLTVAGFAAAPAAAVDGNIDSKFIGNSNVKVGAASQDVGTYVLVDTGSAGDFSGGETVITLPDGVTVNESTSSLQISDNQSGNLDVTGFDVQNDGQTILVNHSGSSGNNEAISIQGLDVDVGTDVNGLYQGNVLNAEVEFFTSTTDETFVAAYRAKYGDTAGGNQAVGAGSQNVTIFSGSALNVTALGSPSGTVGATGPLVIQSDASNGITFNTSAPFDESNVAKEQGLSLDADNSTVTADAISIPVENDSSGATVDLEFQNINIDVAPNANNTTLSVGYSTAAPSVGQVPADPHPSLDEIGILKPQVASGNDTLAAGRNGQPLGPNVNVTASTNTDVQAGTNITFSFNSSDVTFDTSNTMEVVDGPNNSSVDPALITEDSITVNASSSFAAGDEIGLVGANTLVNVSPTVANNTDVGVVVTTGPNQDVTSTDDTSALTIQYPIANFNGGDNFTLAVGDGGNTGEAVTGGSDLTLTETDQEGLPTDSQSNVTIQLEEGTGVTFDQDGTSLSDAGGTLFSSATIVDGDTLNVTVMAAGDGVTDAVFDLDGLQLNGTADATNTSVTFSVNTTGTSQDAGEIIVVDEQPVNADFNGGSDLTVDVDNDASGMDAVTGTAGTTATVNFPVDDDVPSSTFNVTLDVEQGTGVTFDQSSSPGVTATAGTPGTPVVVDEDTVNVTITSPVQNDGVSVDFSSLSFNVSGTASNASLFVSINESGVSDREATGQVVPNELTPDVLERNTNGNAAFDETADETATVTVGGNSTLELRVDNSSNTGAPYFGGATVDLAVNDTSTGVTTNVSSVTTASDGTAEFNVTGGTVANADYNVTLSLANNASISKNITVSTTAGGAGQLNATTYQNGIAFDSSDTTADENVEVAAIEVRIEDSNGNLVSSSTSIDITQVGLNTSGKIVGYADDIGSDRFTIVSPDEVDEGSPTGTTQTVSDGVFYIAVARGSGTQDVQVTVQTGSLTGDTATTTIYDEVGEVAVAQANQTDGVTDGQDVDVEYTLSTAAGETIEVAGLTVATGSSDTGVLTAKSGTVTTDSSGVANVTFDAVGAGTADATGTDQRSSILGSTSITVEALPGLSIESGTLTPDTVTSEATVDHELVYDVNGVSNDGNSDTFTVTLPNTTTINSANSLNVTDADGDEISISSSPSLADANGGNDNQVTFGIQPDSQFDTQTVTVDANITVAFPNVTSPVTAPINASVSDSNAGSAGPTTVADVTIEPQTTTELVVSNLSAPGEAAAGDAINVTADVTNTGTGDATNATVEFRFDLDDDGNLTAGEALLNQSVDVAAGSTTEVTFEVPAGTTSGLGGDYVHGVFTADSNQTATIVIDAASVTLDDQTVLNGSSTVTVASATLSEGGFVVIHSTPVVPTNGTAADSVIGNSSYIADNASDIEITLNETITANTTLVAMAHQDTNDNQLYEFPSADGPYTENGSPVVDAGNITVQDSPFTQPFPGEPGTPQDLNDDGLYEDVNGDGQLTFDDIIAFAFNLDATLTSEQADALDFDGSGTVDFADVIELAFNLGS